ncbi:MAG: PD40 domain-containing protein [Methanomethylovorans sp.]|jgi:TolB protein|nr:PD40 domain-containing protein [Methanomethylovorans sp.]
MKYWHHTCKNSRFYFCLFYIVFLLCCGISSGSPILNNIQVTSGVNEDSPAWSPDGKKLVYTSNQDIWITNVDGSASRKLYGSMSWDGDAVFLDSNSIVFASEQVDAFSSRFISIHRIGIDGTGRKQLTKDANARWPALSPDGRKIAYSSRIANDYDIWIMATDGTSKVRLTDHKGNEKYPSWSPDGKYVFYSLEGDIFKTEVSSGITFQLTNDTFQNTDPEVSPDGNLIIFVSTRNGNQDLWLMDIQGKRTLQLTSDYSIQKGPSWSPDGKRIAYVSDASGEFNIWVMTLDDIFLFEQNEENEKIIEDENKSSFINRLLTEKPEITIGAAGLLVIVFVFFMIRKFLKKVGFI